MFMLRGPSRFTLLKAGGLCRICARASEGGPQVGEESGQRRCTAAGVGGGGTLARSLAHGVHALQQQQVVLLDERVALLGDHLLLDVAHRLGRVGELGVDLRRHRREPRAAQAHLLDVLLVLDDVVLAVARQPLLHVRHGGPPAKA